MYKLMKLSVNREMNEEIDLPFIIWDMRFEIGHCQIGVEGMTDVKSHMVNGKYSSFLIPRFALTLARIYIL